MDEGIDQVVKVKPHTTYFFCYILTICVAWGRHLPLARLHTTGIGVLMGHITFRTHKVISNGFSKGMYHWCRRRVVTVCGRSHAPHAGASGYMRSPAKQWLRRQTRVAFGARLGGVASAAPWPCRNHTFDTYRKGGFTLRFLVTFKKDNLTGTNDGAVMYP